MFQSSDSSQTINKTLPIPILVLGFRNTKRKNGILEQTLIGSLCCLLSVVPPLITRMVYFWVCFCSAVLVSEWLYNCYFYQFWYSTKYFGNNGNWVEIVLCYLGRVGSYIHKREETRLHRTSKEKYLKGKHLRFENIWFSFKLFSFSNCCNYNINKQRNHSDRTDRIRPSIIKHCQFRLFIPHSLND